MKSSHDFRQLSLEPLLRIFDGRKTGMVVGKKKKGVEENNYSEKSDCSIVGPTYTLTLGCSKSKKVSHAPTFLCDFTFLKNRCFLNCVNLH